MADGRALGLTPNLPPNIEHILQEAQHRWLRPVEICEILRNYHKFHISPEPPNKPPGGSLCLFDRKVLKYFRKDGHNWRKKKDGKTVNEAHEKLKTGSIDVLHCYYAHGEDNGNFQRRSYWMLEEELMHIVLVHYRDVKGRKSNYLQPRENGTIPCMNSEDSPAYSNSSSSQLPSHASELDSPYSTRLSEYEDANSDNFQQSSRYNAFIEMQHYEPSMNVSNASDPASTENGQCDHHRSQTAPNVNVNSAARKSVVGSTFTGTQTEIEKASWHEILERCTTGLSLPSFDKVVPFTCVDAVKDRPQGNFVAHDNALKGDLSAAKEDVVIELGKALYQINDIDQFGSLVSSNTNDENMRTTECNLTKHPFDQSLTDSEGLKTYESLFRWMSNELKDLDESPIISNSGRYLSVLESENVVVECNLPAQEQLGPLYLIDSSISHFQLFSIIDFFPQWAYTELETRILIKGRFLMNKEVVQKYRWSCMFGEIEVPADILFDGTLCCLAPFHESGRVPFYVTCSNRLACSEIREFEYRVNEMQKLENLDLYSDNSFDVNLHFRLDKLLILESVDHSSPDGCHANEGFHPVCTVCSMMMEIDNELLNLFKNTTDEVSSHVNAKDKLLEDPLKEKLHIWLLHKVGEDGKGPNVMDKEGQGVLHLAAALGYDWAIKPTIAAGVNINFRDVNGWTALHWAAFCGRERTVAMLIQLYASPGALTDPTPELPFGRTPADLASQNGHKGIAGFLAVSSLTNHLRNLTLKDSEGTFLSESSSLSAFNHFAEKNGTQLAYGESQPSLKDSLSALRNAVEAAACIYQVFRTQSFHRKKEVEYSDEGVPSLIFIKNKTTGKHDMPVHTAAIKIQNKFRGWKVRKDFLNIRQHIVKIQAHVRGHQVRKHYRKILWSVGIVEKAVLRWRRKGSGLRGFRREGQLEGYHHENQALEEEDDFDFLKEGRKQSEARLETALARVKSMVQHPEARDQYTRLLTVVTELQESKLFTSNEMVKPVNIDLMMELEGLLGNDSLITQQ